MSVETSRTNQPGDGDPDDASGGSASAARTAPPTRVDLDDDLDDDDVVSPDDVVTP